MNTKINIILVFLLLLLAGCATVDSIVYRAEMKTPPPGSMQLNPAIFLPEFVFHHLGIREGDPVWIIHRNRQIELRAYLLPDTTHVFALHKKYAEELGLNYQTVSIKIKKIPSGKATLNPRPLRRYMEIYRGKPDRWLHIAIGAPHGDCDMETGNIVRLTSQKYGIPAAAAYGYRLSYRGIWWDVNRPLMKLPKKEGGVHPERVWNRQAETVYLAYQDSLFKAGGLHPGERFELFCSFHGHDLTVRLPEGKRVERPVIEGMGVGFSYRQLRRIKAFYRKNSHRYFTSPPALYFGNLPEDRKYSTHGVTVPFFYSGLGTRTYGSLRSDLVKYALHLETPNSIRLNPDVQPHTARFLYELYRFILDSVITIRPGANSNTPKIIPPPDFGKKVTVPGGLYPMGAPDNIGWGSEHPQHPVKIDPFEIDIYEVTNRQFVRFLNEAFQRNLIRVENGVVKDARQEEHILCRTREAAPFSQIQFDGKRFSVIPGKNYFPVVYVSYYGARMYARHNKERLPTEAEWEMAASWSPRLKRKFLYAVAADTVIGKWANFENSGDPFETGPIPATTPVGYYRKSSPMGVADMSGNVWEWCSDYYQYDYYRQSSSGTWKNPAGPRTGTMRVIRGGAWNTEFAVTRTTMRLGIHPNATLINVGFRCVKSGQ